MPLYRRKKNSGEYLAFNSNYNLQQLQQSDSSQLALCLFQKKKSVGKTWKSQMPPHLFANFRCKIAWKAFVFS